jgi:CDP-diacylglycerol--serine O-phosphatidyltransferase
MVSNFRYHSFKEIDLKSKVPFVVIFAVAMGLVIVTIDPPRVLLAISVIYALSAPTMYLWQKIRRKPTAS